MKTTQWFLISCFMVSAPFLMAQETISPDATPVQDSFAPLANPNSSKLTNDNDGSTGKTAIVDKQVKVPVQETAFSLTSSAFEPMGMIPADHASDGGNVVPPLTIAGVPTGTVSLALICENPDAERGAPWVHWVAWNIGPNIGQITRGELTVTAVTGSNSWGRNRWDGPAPNKGTNRYVFTLYALDAVLRLPNTTDAKGLKEAMQGHILGTTTLAGRYSARD